MTRLMKAVLCGVFLGFIGTIALLFVFCKDAWKPVFGGFGVGLGAGFGAVLALLAWNKLVGYLDRVASGKA